MPSDINAILERAAGRVKRVAHGATTEGADGDKSGDQQGAKTPRTASGLEPEGKKKRQRQPPEADSDATTVGASEEEVRRAVQQRQEAAKRQQESLTTPKDKIKHSLSGLSASSTQPKLRRDVQSREILGPETKVEPKAKSTAVKAKAAPPQQPKTEVASTPKTRIAVHECLRRGSTQELQSTPAPSRPTPTPSPVQSISPPANVPQQQPDQHEENQESSEEDAEEAERLAAAARAKREAHARYMRFSRSLTSPKTPKEVQRAGRAAYHNSPMLQVLMEQWTACNGAWTESEMFLQMKQKKKNRQYGSRRWMCRGEIAAKFGSNAVAEQIVNAKENDAEASKSQIRANPDLHGIDTPETRQYLVWDREGTEETVDFVTETLFRAADRDESPRGRSKEKDKSKGKRKAKSGKAKTKGKKTKKKARSSSSSSSSSSGSESKSSTTSSSGSEAKAEAKKKKKQKKGSKANKAKEDKKASKDDKSEEDAKPETEAQRKKREQKEEAKAERERKQEAEKEKKRLAKEETDAFKKDQRKGTQALNKLGVAIAKATNIGDKLNQMSASVVTAIMEEVKPHMAQLKKCRTRLQKSVDDAKVGSLGTLMDDIADANSKMDTFGSFLAAYNIK